MEQTKQLLIALLVLCQVFPMNSSSIEKFVSEEIPAGKALDSAKVLETKQANPIAGQDMICAIYCTKLTTCRGFLVKDGTCTTFFELKIITDPSVAIASTLYALLPRRVLLLRHDKANGGNFPLFSTHGSWYLNENDPEAPNYSIFGDVDKYKDKNGVYHFEMCYPNYPGMGPDSCFVFEQASDPRRSSGPTVGFILHSEPMGFENRCSVSDICSLKGLTADDQYYSWLDGNPVNTAQWCFAAGASRDWPAGGTAFPGFCDPSNGHKAHFVEIYTYEDLE